MIFGGSHVLADHESILGDSPPCHTRCLPWNDGRKNLIFSKKRSEMEQVVRELRLGREV